MSQSSLHAVRLSDTKRIQKVLDELGGRTNSGSSSRNRTSAIDDNAQRLLMEYTFELTTSLIDAASKLAKHRESNVIEAEDISLILAKKMGIEVPGQPRIKSLHQHHLKSLYVPSGSAAMRTSSSVVATVASAAEERKAQGVKRKHQSGTSASSSTKKETSTSEA